MPFALSAVREVLLGAVLTLPWLLLPALAVRRQRRTVSLNDYSASTNDVAPPRVSVVLPARNEATHIAECIESLRRTTWPNVEIIVVNDHSSDNTLELARIAAATDARVRIIDAPDLPPGWFGKQWACHNGALIATGELLLFTDADTRHAPDLIARMAHAREQRGAHLLSVAGTQAMHSFWEYAIQPAVFTILLVRYGGTLEMERATRSVDVIANGQCLMLTRGAYDEIGGHVSVRDTVAEDLMLAQRTQAHGLRVSLVLGRDQITTHMYSGLAAIFRGWMKNVYAGGRLSMRGGALGRMIFPVVLVAAPLIMALPFVMTIVLAVVALAGVDIPFWLLTWCVLTNAGMLWFFGAINTISHAPRWRVILVPLGMLMFVAICAAAVVRGQTVEWKGRTYRAA